MLTKDARSKIARSYFLGATPVEVSREYGIPAAHVIMIAKRYDLECYRQRAKHTAGGRKRMHIVPPPAAPAMPADNQSDRYTVERDGMRITLPMFSILRKAA